MEDTQWHPHFMQSKRTSARVNNSIALDEWIPNQIILHGMGLVHTGLNQTERAAFSNHVLLARRFKRAPVEFEGRFAVGYEVRDAVSAGIEVKLVRDCNGFQQLIEGTRAAVETERVVGAAIEIDFRSLQRGCIFPGQQERTIEVPHFAVYRVPKHIGQHLRGQIPGGRTRDHALRRIAHQRGAVGADRPE